MTGTLVSLSQNKVLARKVRCQNRFFGRLRGLLGTSKLEPDEACWLIPCNMVHTFGMRYSIDVAFLNKKNEVVSVVRNLKPNRISPFVRSAHSVVEFSSGSHPELAVGDQLALSPSPSPLPLFAKDESASGGQGGEDSAKDRGGSATNFGGKGEGVKSSSNLDSATTRMIFKSQRGQATIEMAFAILFFLVILFVLGDLARIGYNWMALQFAVSEAARLGSLGRTDDPACSESSDVRGCSITNKVIHVAGDLGLDQVTVEVTDALGEPGAGGSLEFFTLMASRELTINNFTGLLLKIAGQHTEDFTVTATTVIRNEPF